MNAEPSPVRWREPFAVAWLIALCDVAIYRGEGYAGYGALFAIAPFLLLLGAPRVKGRWSLAVVGAMLALLALRLIWCGSLLQACLGFALLIGFAMSIAGLPPYVLEGVAYGGQSLVAGLAGVRQYLQWAAPRHRAVGRVAWTAYLLPAAALVVFGTIFVLANPDLMTFFGEEFQQLYSRTRDFLVQYAPTPGEMLFWGLIAWIAAGLLRPLTSVLLSAEALDAIVLGDGGDEGQMSAHATTPAKPAPAPLYAAFRNLLLTVIVLFAVYLVFEFKTLWFREFPKGFYYSGYAHQGAAWLTFALALATATLSLVFRGALLHDPRLGRLRRLAWLWSLENLVLAAAVVHRMFIYVGFNGMTLMRMVGLFGISAVVAGFLVVLWKIARNRDFLWLVRRQLWALAATIYLFALTPIDAVVHRYNVRRILGGDPAPSVQISVHPIDSQGILLLPPLLEAEDALIREGVAALLAARQDELEALERRRRQEGWTAFQAADRMALDRLRQFASQWSDYGDVKSREEALRRFRDYAYQWY